MQSVCRILPSSSWGTHHASQAGIRKWVHERMHSVQKCTTSSGCQWTDVSLFIHYYAQLFCGELLADEDYALYKEGSFSFPRYLSLLILGMLTVIGSLMLCVALICCCINKVSSRYFVLYLDYDLPLSSIQAHSTYT